MFSTRPGPQIQVVDRKETQPEISARPRHVTSDIGPFRDLNPHRPRPPQTASSSLQAPVSKVLRINVACLRMNSAAEHFQYLSRYSSIWS